MLDIFFLLLRQNHLHNLPLPLTSPLPSFRFLFIQFTMSAFAQAFFRTTKASFSRRTCINPIQYALGPKGTAQYVASCRSYATVFERSKPHVNIGI
jgi:hypothetical protein